MTETLDIAVVGPTQVDEFAWNIAAGLRSLGHRPHLVGSLSTRRGHNFMHKAAGAAEQVLLKHPRTRGAVTRSLTARLLDREYDLAISVESLPPDLVAATAAAGTPMVLWFPDAVSNLGPLWMFSAPYRTLFFKEPVLVDRIRAVQGLPVEYLPEACNPEVHRRLTQPDAIPAVVVAGNYYSTRVRLLERLHKDGIPLQLFGNPFPTDLQNHPLRQLHTGRYVTGLDKAAVFGGAIAVLNNLHPAEVSGVNCRLFEATACGAAVVTEHRPVLPNLYDVGSEVLAFSDYDELLSILHSLVAGRVDQETLRAGAAARALSDHTYQIRLRTLLSLSE